MGLDMYLLEVKDSQKIEEDFNIFENSKEIGYWRKANHIHKWFVDNVQDGVDECDPYLVSLEKIKQLLNVCNAVSLDNSLAEELLPRQEGFFFGGYQYGGSYFDEIYSSGRHRAEMLKNVSEGNVKYCYYNESEGGFIYEVNGECLESGFFVGKFHKESGTLWLDLISTAG